MNFDVTFQEQESAMNVGFGEGFGSMGAKIDDTSISARTTWSSQNIVDKLCPSFNESGATVTCEPLEGLPLEVVSHIVPMQAGSGDPSLTNIRPITGCDSIKMSRTGKNLFGGEALADKIVEVGGTKDASNGTVTFVPYACDRTNYLFTNLKENTQYTAIVYGSNNSNGAVTNLYFKYTDGTYDTIAFNGTSPNEKVYGLGVSKAGKTVSFFGIVVADGITTIEYEKCGLFEGVISLGDFEPYNNNSETFSIDLGQTVYGGTFNWYTGRLSVSYASIVFDGVTQGKKVTSTDAGAKTYAYFQPVINGSVEPVKPIVGGKIYSDRAGCKLSGNGALVIVSIPVDVTGVTDGDNATSVVTKINSTLKSWYDAGTPLTCVYELATPTTVQLTPQEILALSGTNVLSSNTGNTEVKGKAVADSVIQDLYNKLNALTATLTALTGV